MKNNLKFYKTFLLTILVVLISSCLTNVDEEEVLDPDALDPCADITFSVDVKKIIDNNCITCHSAGGGQSPNLETYNGVSANADIIKSEVVSKEMPIGGSLTNEEIAAISCWVDAGALNN
jgi:uncharacterized membrane protein